MRSATTALAVMALLGAMACPLMAQAEGKEEAGQVSVTLVGGAKVVGTLLRQNTDGIVLDLGYDALTIPAAKVLDIRQPDGEAADAPTEAAGIFTVGRLEAKEISELVGHFGDAVVMVRTPAGLGSGFVISDQGHLITNYHVVENETRISVTLFSQTAHGYARQEVKDVRILALQPLRDMALLQLDVSQLEDWAPRPVVIAEESDLRVGDLIFAIGNPLGLERSVTQGIVSSTTRTMGHLRFIQTDASINPGNSGGPLFNARGEVVGIVCAGATFFDGLAFGIPASELLDFLRNRNAYLYDPSQPQNGVKYLAPPYHAPAAPGEPGEQGEPVDAGAQVADHLPSDSSKPGAAVAQEESQP